MSFENTLNCLATRFSRHAFERMFDRAITPTIVEQVIAEGEIIADYSDDQPYPSVLTLGFNQLTPIHVVAVRNPENGDCHVITVYSPDPTLWDATFKHRRQP